MFFISVGTNCAICKSQHAIKVDYNVILTIDEYTNVVQMIEIGYT